MWLNGVGQNRETDEEHDEDCAEEGFPSVKFDRDGKGGREAFGMGYCGGNTRYGLLLKLSLSR